jgi:hypothetical protein
MTITLDSTVRASADQISANLEADTAILHFTSGTYFGLDEVGGFIWNKLQEPVRVVRLRDEVVSEFDVDEPTAENDLLQFLGDLAGKGLVEVVAE